jgi:hypothetical protein
MGIDLDQIFGRSNIFVFKCLFGSTSGLVVTLDIAALEAYLL